MRDVGLYTHHRASPLVKQTRYGVSISVSTAIAKPYPWRQCFVRLEGRNASGTPLPSIHASCFPATDVSPPDFSSPLSRAVLGFKSSRIANTTPLAAWAKKAHIATKLSHMKACELTHTRVKLTCACYVGRLQRSEPTQGLYSRYFHAVLGLFTCPEPTGGPRFECE